MYKYTFIRITFYLYILNVYGMINFLNLRYLFETRYIREITCVIAITFSIQSKNCSKNT